MTAERIHKLTARLAAARQRADDAMAQVDEAGARYAMAEVRRMRRALAEG
jgi:hypothetical protein